jgi:hypothetical protein
VDDGLPRPPTLNPLANQLANGITFTLLLTDGTVLAQDGTYYNQWWKLTPDINGSYLNGIWTQLASLPVSYSPLYSAEAVLADGRVVVIGGEYSGPNSDFTLTNEGAIYDPRTDTWTPLAPPPGIANIGDSPSTVLPDGRFLLGEKLTQQVSALDPSTLRWKNLKSKDKNDFNAEEGWTLLPDGSVLTLDVLDAPQAEAYSTSGQKWDHLREVPVDLHSPTTVVGCLPYGPAPDQCYYTPRGDRAGHSAAGWHGVRHRVLCQRRSDFQPRQRRTHGDLRHTYGHLDSRPRLPYQSRHLLLHQLPNGR